MQILHTKIYAIIASRGYKKKAEKTAFFFV